MVKMILRERTLDCICKTREKIRQRVGRYKNSELQAVLGCEYLLYLLRLNDMYSIDLSFQSYITCLTTLHKLSTVGITYEALLNVT